MPGKFELFEDANGKYRFRLTAADGAVIAHSEAYSSKSAAKKGVAAVQQHAGDASVIDLTA